MITCVPVTVPDIIAMFFLGLLRDPSAIQLFAKCTTRTAYSFMPLLPSFDDPCLISVGILVPVTVVAAVSSFDGAEVVKTR